MFLNDGRPITGEEPAEDQGGVFFSPSVVGTARAGVTGIGVDIVFGKKELNRICPGLTAQVKSSHRSFNLLFVTSVVLLCSF